MKNALYFIVYLGLNLVCLNIYSPATSRFPSSINTQIVSSCIKIVRSFLKKPVIDESAYLEYLKKYKDSQIVDKDKAVFESLEDYSAWLDWRVSKKEFSVVKHYLNPGLMGEIKKVKLSLSRPDQISHFFFGKLLDSIIKKSIKIEGLDNYRYLFLKSFLSKKISDEALLEFHKTSGEKSLWARMSHSKFSRGISNLISYAPVAFGYPPLKVPSFLLKSEKELLAAKSVDEAFNIYENFSLHRKSLLAAKISYDHFKKFYILGVASYYMYFTYLDFEIVDDQEDMLVQVSNELDHSTQDLIELISPSCQSVINCLEEYRTDWDNSDNNLYYEYKNTCKEVYNIQEDC